MTPRCEQVQGCLADNGLAALRGDPELNAHLAGCEDCHAVLVALSDIDRQIGELDPIDAADGLVEATLARVRALSDASEAGLAADAGVAEVADVRPEASDIAEDIEATGSTPVGLEPPVASDAPPVTTGGLLRRAAPSRARWADLAAAVRGAVAAVLRWPLRHPRHAVLLAGAAAMLLVSLVTLSRITAVYDRGRPMSSGDRWGGVDRFVSILVEDEQGSPGPIPAGSVSPNAPPPARASASAPDEAAAGSSIAELGASGVEHSRVAEDDDGVDRRFRLRERAEARDAGGMERAAIEAAPSRPPDARGLGELGPDSDSGVVSRSQLALSAVAEVEELRLPESGPADEAMRDQALEEKVEGVVERGVEDRWRSAGAVVAGGATAVGWGVEAGNAEFFSGQSARDSSGLRGVESPAVGDTGSLEQYARAQSDARAFLARWSTLEGLSFRAPRGYWANTYVPGDPVIRALQRRLGSPESRLELELAHGARTVAQPFDAPEQSAIAVYLDTDVASASGPTRMRVQVGVRGTDRRAGRRPSMNIGVVVDLRDAPSVDDAGAIRALLEALSEASDIGDQFSLVVAGRPGGVLIEPGPFGYGPVSIAASRMLGENLDARSGEPTFGLYEACTEALRRVAASDDPNAPLGSSLLLLVTPGVIGGELSLLDGLVHGAAVDGIPTSVVGVGNGIDLYELDRIALSGQGNRRLLERAADAAGLVDREISAAGRVVARAVRLRIRLAPGARLIDVLGSRRLDEVQAQRVRDAEQAIDQRISRSLGIEADRGDDEGGIQIVIPAFYAGDSHAILLDVVVPGPGPIADVTVRYKDLVHLRNGVARANITMGRGAREPGPLELNVLKNLVAFSLSETLRAAGALASERRVGQAADEIAAVRSILIGLGGIVPGFDTDADLAADLALVGHFLDAFATGGAHERPNALADSLLYAGYLKLLEPPLDSEEVTP